MFLVRAQNLNNHFDLNGVFEFLQSFDIGLSLVKAEPENANQKT
jgi:hypothetical protein